MVARAAGVVPSGFPPPSEGANLPIREDANDQTAPFVHHGHDSIAVNSESTRRRNECATGDGFDRTIRLDAPNAAIARIGDVNSKEAAEADGNALWGSQLGGRGRTSITGKAATQDPGIAAAGKRSDNVALTEQT
jgi:hypothetical protein